MTDVIVVGGGLAGSALAVFLARQGLEVELYEQGSFPRDKPCGEGLMPGGVEVLRALGLEADVAGETLKGVRYHVGDSSVRAGFNRDSEGHLRHGLGQRRLLLDAVLWRAAAATPGVRAEQGMPVQGPLLEDGRVSGVLIDGQPRRASCVVAADGSSSTLRRRSGLERTLEPRRVGIRTHFRRPSHQVRLEDVQIFVRDGYELYVTPLPGNEVLVAALAHQDVVRGSLRRSFQDWLAQEPLLCLWLEGAQQTSEVLGRAPLLRAAPPAGHPAGLILIGDACTSVDPITAGGMSLALTSAELLARRMPALLRGRRGARRSFQRAQLRAIQVHRFLGASLLRLGQNPAAARRACALMQACPGLMRSLVALASRRSMA